jgi:hypothetical protein
MMQGRLFWLIWLLVGCQLAWTAVRALAAPWIWNPYQCITAIFLFCLPVGLAWLGLLWSREGMNGIRARVRAFETEIETPRSRIGFRWNLAFWIVAVVLASAYFNMEQK